MRSKKVLRDAYHKATYLYAKAAREFSNNVGRAMTDDLEFLWIKVEQAQKIALYTRAFYESHISGHGC